MFFSQKNLEIWGKTASGSRDSSEKKNDAALLEVSYLNEKTPENGLEHQFDAYCKKLLKNEARDGYKEEQRRWKDETPISALSEQELSQLQEMDEYPSDLHHFLVMGEAVDVRDDLLGLALDALPEHKRLITLMAYCLNLPDVRISTLLNVGRRAVQYQRLQSLKEIKRHMEEHKDDE